MVHSTSIAKEFNLRHEGSSKNIATIGSIAKQSEKTLVWAGTVTFASQVDLGILLTSKSIFEKIEAKPDVSYLITSESPRLLFAQVFRKYFGHLEPEYFENHVHEHIQNSKIKIGERVFIGRDVKIGDGTEIQHNTTIFSGTELGIQCRIGTGVTIGSSGLGFEKLGNTLMEFPQIGNVVIGDYVSIADNTSIRRASLDSTVIGNHCKIGTSCNIGHNCKIGDLCILTAHVCMAGSSELGENNYIGMNVSIRNKVILGDNVTVAMGAAVISDFSSNCIIGGIPARVFPSSEN